MKTTRPPPLASPEADLSMRLGASRSAPYRSLRWGLFCPVAFALGAAAYFVAPSEPGWALLAGSAALFWGLSSLSADDSPAMRVFCVFVALVCLGALVGKARTWMSSAPRLYVQTEPVSVEGVVSSVEAGASGPRLRIRVSAIQGLQRDETPKWVRITHRSDLRVRPGRTVRCRAILSPPPAPSVPGDYDFRRQAHFQQLGAVGFALGACAPATNAPPQTALDWLASHLGAARRLVAEHVFAASGNSAGGGVAAAMASGDRSFIALEDADALRSAGLAHLLAISGLHMGLAGGVFFFAVRRIWPLFAPLALRVPAPKAAALTALLACTGYLALSGASVATQRAYIMAAVALLAILFDRPAFTLRLLALAMALVTVLQPETVTTPGFHMSFAATAALIGLYEAWPRGRAGGRGVLGRVGGWMASLGATSVAASLATAPFAVFHFGRTAGLSIPANLAAMPIISLWTAPVAGIAAFASLFGASEPFFAVMAVSLDQVLAVAHFAADHGPPVQPPIMPPISLLLFVLGVALGCALRGRLRATGLIAFAGAAIMWSTALQPAAHFSEDGTVYIRVDEGWRSWRPTSLSTRKGLKPFAVEGPAPALACADMTDCRVDTPFGALILSNPAPIPEEGSAEPRHALLEGPLQGALLGAPQGPSVRFVPLDARVAGASISLDYAMRRGGASLLVGDRGRRIRYRLLEQSDRRWR